MKKLLFIFVSLFCLFNFSSCKRDRIDHTDSEYIYVWKYTIKGDSTLYKYHQPIEHSTVITNKRSSRRYVGVPGKGGHSKTTRYISYYINGKEVEESNYDGTYYKVDKGTRIVVREQFYPRYSRKIIKIYN